MQENIERFFTRFVEEGKATVRLREPAVDVCLSKVGAGVAAGGTPGRNRCLAGNRGGCGGGRGGGWPGSAPRPCWVGLSGSVCLSVCSGSVPQVPYGDRVLTVFLDLPQPWRRRCKRGSINEYETSSAGCSKKGSTCKGAHRFCARKAGPSFFAGPCSDFSLLLLPLEKQQERKSPFFVLFFIACLEKTKIFHFSDTTSCSLAVNSVKQLLLIVFPVKKN